VSRPGRNLSIVAALLGAAGGGGCDRRGDPRSPVASNSVTTIGLPSVPTGGPAQEAGASPAAPALPDHLAEPPPVEPRPGYIYTTGKYDADAGDFRPPAGYALLVARGASGDVLARTTLPGRVRACIGRGPAVLRLRIAPHVDAGADFALDEQEGLEAPAAACVIDQLRKDPSRWPVPADRDEPMVFDVIVR